MPESNDRQIPHSKPNLQHQKLVKAARARVDTLPDADTIANANETHTEERQSETKKALQAGNSNRHLGRFELVERLGAGGFAAVWKAFDPHLDRMVAVKIPKYKDISASEAELFLREARTASQVRHPHVVRLHEVGRDGDSIYLVSDLIDGLPLNAWDDEQTLLPRQVAELCETIAQALSAIHTAGIVHRDLKPSNILIDAAGQPHITDFGLAKRPDAEATLTLDGQMMGTPAYMSPEQARGESREVTITSDIYSFGVLMFELLTGELPFRGQSHAILSQTIHDDPPSPRTLNPRIPRDLETICLRCLEKNPSARFVSADALAAELKRFLNNEPILSRPTGLPIRAIRWCRRNPVASLLVAILCVVAVVGPILALRFRALAEQALAAQSATQTSEREKSELLYVSQINALQQAVEQDDSQRARQLLDAQIPQTGQADLRDFEWYYWRGQIQKGLLWELGSFGMLESVTVSHDGRWVAWGGGRGVVTLRNLETEESFELPAQIDDDGKPLTVYRLAFSPIENLLAIGRDESKVTIFSTTERSEISSLSTERYSIRALTFSDDGTTLAVGTVSGTLELWSAMQPESHRVIQVTKQSLRSLDFSADGQRLIAVVNSNNVGYKKLRCLEVPTGRVLSEWSSEDQEVAGLVAEFSADDQEVFYNSDYSFSVQRFGAETLAVMDAMAFRSNSSVSAIAATSDGKQLIAGGDRGELLAWDLESGEVVEKWPGHDSRIMEIAILPEGKRMLTCGFDGYVRCWAMNGAELNQRDLRFPGLQSCDFQFSPDSQRFYLAGTKDSSTALYAWDIARGAMIWQSEMPNVCGGHLAITPDGSQLITSHTAGRVSFWKAETGELIETVDGHRADRGVSLSEISPRGHYLATGEVQPNVPPFTDELTEQIFVWDLPKRQVVHRWFAHDRKVGPMLFVPGKNELISYGYGKRLLRWRISTQEVLTKYEIGPHVVRGLHLINDGRVLVASDSTGTVWRWSFASGQLLGRLVQRGGIAYVSDISPSGRTLALPISTSSLKKKNGQGVVKLIDTRTWEQKGALPAKLGHSIRVKFSPDGQYLAASDYHGQIYLWCAPKDTKRESSD